MSDVTSPTEPARPEIWRYRNVYETTGPTRREAAAQALWEYQNPLDAIEHGWRHLHPELQADNRHAVDEVLHAADAVESSDAEKLREALRAIMRLLDMTAAFPEIESICIAALSESGSSPESQK